MENQPPTSGQTPSPLDAHLGFWMRLVSNHVSGRFRGLMEREGVSVSEWVVLRALYDGDITTHAALIEVLGMTKGAISKILSRMERKQLVQRGHGDDNAKSQTLSLTEQGRDLLPKLAGFADENDALFFGCLGEEDQQMLSTLLRRLAAFHNLTDTPIS